MRAPMCKVRVGCDVLEIRRLVEALARGGACFTAELFTKAELATAGGDMVLLSRLFAVKEAAIKVLGIGLAEGISPLNFEVIDAATRDSGICRPMEIWHTVAMRGLAKSILGTAPMAAFSWHHAAHIYACAYIQMRETIYEISVDRPRAGV